jgi:hypothetical protein
VAPVERGVRVLKNYLELTNLLLRAPPQRRQHVTVEGNAAMHGLEQPEQRARERRLAAARLANQPERLPGPDLDRHAGQRMDLVAALVKHGGEIVNPKQRLAF